MAISKLKILLLSAITVSAALADSSDDSALSAFHQLNPDSRYVHPQPESNYFARLAQTPSRLRGYAGLGLGVDMSNLTPAMTFGKIHQAVDSDSLKNSIVVDGYGGVGTNFRNFYIGSELSCDYNSLNKNFSTVAFAPNTQMTVKKSFTFGLDLIPGFLSPEQSFLFYGRMGLGGSWFNIKIENKDGSKDDYENGSKWNRLNLAWRLGAGMEYFMGESMSWRLDYVFSANNKITQNFTDPLIGACFYRLPSLNDHKITLGLTFNF